MQVDVPESPAIPKIKFYNMDLDVMHNNLYQDQYLCLEEFMADIVKIAHNAEVAHRLMRTEPDRLHKAQALVTAAQVHYHDFDPNFRAECAKMAERMKKRREEERKKEEERLAEEKRKEGEYAPGTRRSNRANGLAPELGITDIGKVERSLKRLRSSEPGSSKEDGGHDDDNRSNKRSRLSEDDTDQQGQGVNVDGGNNGMPVQEGDTPQPQVLAPATPSPPLEYGQPSLMNNVHPPASTDALPVLPDTAPLQSSMSLSSLLNAEVPFAQVQTNNQNYPMMNGGFSFQQSASGQVPLFPPTLPLGTPQIPSGQQFLNPSELSPILVPPIMPIPTFPTTNQAEMVTPTSALPIVESQPLAVNPPSPERTPTPPPDFIVDESLMDKLRTALVHDTSMLEVEQLEQLRASALDTIWRARSTWNRTALMNDLLALVYEFVQDVQLSFAEFDREEQVLMQM